MLAAGVMLHLGIDLNIQIGIFSYAMMVLYVAWIAPDTAQLAAHHNQTRDNPVARTTTPRPPTPTHADTHTGRRAQPPHPHLTRAQNDSPP